MYDPFDVYKIHYPTTPGWEGAGKVVSSGGGMMANGMIGKRVAFVRITEANEMKLGGCYQQFALADAMSCVYLPENIPSDIGSMHFVNPLTSIGLCEEITKNKSTAAI